MPWAGGRLVCQEPLLLGEGANLGMKPPGGKPAGEPGERAQGAHQARARGSHHQRARRPRSSPRQRRGSTAQRTCPPQGQMPGDPASPSTQSSLGPPPVSSRAPGEPRSSPGEDRPRHLHLLSPRQRPQDVRTRVAPPQLPLEYILERQQGRHRAHGVSSPAVRGPELGPPSWAAPRRVPCRRVVLAARPRQLLLLPAWNLRSVARCLSRDSALYCFRHFPSACHLLSSLPRRPGLCRTPLPRPKLARALQAVWLHTVHLGLRCQPLEGGPGSSSVCRGSHGVGPPLQSQEVSQPYAFI